MVGRGVFVAYLVKGSELLCMNNSIVGPYELMRLLVSGSWNTEDCCVSGVSLDDPPFLNCSSVQNPWSEFSS